jgi:DNA polymerase-3 subunit alpha
MYLSSHPLDTYQFEIENFTTCQLSDINTLVSECEMKKTKMKLAVAGLVTNAEHFNASGTSRPWSKTTIEDFGGKYELKLYGKDHEAFMSYMTLHNPLMIEGEITERFYLKPEERAQGKTSPYTFKVKKIMLLGNVTETYIKAFSINITTPMLSPAFRERLVKMIKRNKGNVPLTMFLYDPEKGWNIEFLSRKFKVSVTASFLAELQELGITYSVIKK